MKKFKAFLGWFIISQLITLIPTFVLCFGSKNSFLYIYSCLSLLLLAIIVLVSIIIFAFKYLIIE